MTLNGNKCKEKEKGSQFFTLNYDITKFEFSNPHEAINKNKYDTIISNNDDEGVMMHISIGPMGIKHDVENVNRKKHNTKRI